MKISIVIPAYNEEKRISTTLEAYSKFYKNIKDVDVTILIVINDSKDKTLDIVKNYAKKDKKVKFINLEKGGKGYAVIEGFKRSLAENNEFIGFVDADLATSPQELHKLYSFLIKNNSYGAAIADRYLPTSEVHPKATFRRIVVSRIFNFITRALFLMPYRDTQCGAKVFRKKALESIINALGMTKWAFDIEVIYRLQKNGFNIKPLPTKWYDKEYSKINFLKAGPWMGLAIIRLRIINSPFRRFIRIYDKLIGFIPK